MVENRSEGLLTKSPAHDARTPFYSVRVALTAGDVTDYTHKPFGFRTAFQDLAKECDFIASFFFPINLWPRPAALCFPNLDASGEERGESSKNDLFDISASCCSSSAQAKLKSLVREDRLPCDAYRPPRR